MSLQVDEYPRNSLDRLPIEIKVIVVTMAAEQNRAYRSREALEKRGIFDVPSDDLAGNSNLHVLAHDRAEGEPGAIAQVCHDAKRDIRRQWRRQAGHGVGALFQINREFALLAAPHLFTVSTV